MRKGELQCILLGQDVKIYIDLVKVIKGFEPCFRFKQVSATKLEVKNTLKKNSGTSLVFISDEVAFSLELLSDLVWQNTSDAIVVILTRKTKTTILKEPFNNTQFAKLHFVNESKETLLALQFLIQSAQMKLEFRRCKSLLGISEKRCQWLVDSSREAVAFISRDIHLYANTPFLSLFKIGSIQELRSISVKDLINVDEHQQFESFQKGRSKTAGINHSLILTMKKKNGATFRSNTHIIPSVYKGRKCFQLWVRTMGDLNSEEVEASRRFEGNSIPSKEIVSSTTKFELKHTPEQLLVNPFAALFSDDPKIKNPLRDKSSNNNQELSKVNNKQHSSASLLKGIIKRREATISMQRLVSLKENQRYQTSHGSNYLLSLKVSIAQKKGIDALLLGISGVDRQGMNSIFWDKVKLTRLLQMLLKKKQLNFNIFIRLSEASITDQSFINWLIPGLRRIEDKAASLTFLLPSQFDDKQRKSTIVLTKKLRKFNCTVALDRFTVTQDSISLLKQIKPDYIRLSLPWTRQIQGNKTRESGLSTFIRQLEAKNIRVIAPCGFSIDMKKLFIFSGASFCQERTINNG